MSEIAHQDHTEKKAFLVNSSSLKEVRTFCREVFEKLHIQQDLKDELVLAIAEAAQNIVKHAYNNEQTEDKMEIKISVNCLLYTSPSPRDRFLSRMPSSA